MLQLNVFDFLLICTCYEPKSAYNYQCAFCSPPSFDGPTSSQLGPSLWCFGFLSWVVVAGIVEFSIMVLGVEVVSDGSGNSEEVLHVNAVGDVGVEVVLEVLEHVHVLVHEVVSSDSWEREGSIVKFPGTTLESWGLSGTLLHGLGDVDNIGPVSDIKGSGEHVNLVSEFLWGLIEVFASWLSLKFDEHIVVEIGGGKSILGSGGSNSQEQKCNL
jgi:hypothetical protein